MKVCGCPQHREQEREQVAWIALRERCRTNGEDAQRVILASPLVVRLHDAGAKRPTL